MQIDIAGAPADGAPTIESTGASPKADTTPGSFADMLNAVAEEQNESESADEADEKDSTGDPWMTVPVVVPFVPVIPQDIVDTESADAPADDVSGDEVAAAGVATQLVEAATTPDVTSRVGDEAGQPVETKPAAEATAPIEAFPAVDAQPVQSTSNDQVKPLPDAKTETTAPIASKEPVSAEPAPKAAKVAKATAQKAPEANDVDKALAAAAAVNSARDAVTEQVPASGEASSKNTTSEPASGAKGVAARFARALERATEQAIAPTAQAGENNQASNQDGDGQPSFGEWLREQLPRITTAGAHNAASPAFTLVAPAQNDARVSGLLTSAGVSLPANASAPLNERDVTLQIVQSMRMQFRDGIGEAVLKLKPEHLGAVSISLRVENGGLKANVQADMPAVRQWLESQQDTLRNALAEHGLRLDRFDVEPDGQRQQAGENPRDEPSTRRRQQRRTAQNDEPVFEVVV